MTVPIIISSSKKRGFTLIELLVVIAIIGLLASVVLVNLGSPRKQARDSRRMQDLRQMQLAIEMYYQNNNNVYPPPANGGYGNWSGHCTPYGNLDTYITGLGPYIAQLPRDPQFDSDQKCYVYYSNAGGTQYILIAHDVIESICDGSDADTTADPGDECNAQHIRQMDRTAYEEATIAVYSAGAIGW